MIDPKQWKPKGCQGYVSIYAIAFFHGMSISTLTPVLPFVFVALDAATAATRYGTFLTIFAGVQTVASIVLGVLVERAGIKPTVVGALFLSILGQVGLLRSTRPIELYATRIVAGMGFQLSLVRTLFARHDSSVTAFGTIGVVQGLTLCIGPAIGGVLYHFSGLLLVLSVTLVCLVSAFFFALAWTPPSYEDGNDDSYDDVERRPLRAATDDDTADDASDVEEDDGAHATESKWADTLAVVALLIANLLFRAVFAAYKTNFAFLCQRLAGWSEHHVGMALSVVGAYGIFVQGVVIPWLDSCCAPSSIYTMGTAMLSVGLGGLVVCADVRTFALCVLVCMTGYGLIVPSLSALLACSSKRKATIQGWAGSCDRSGQALGSVLGGLLVDRIGFKAAYLSLGITLGAGTWTLQLLGDLVVMRPTEIRRTGLSVVLGMCVGLWISTRVDFLALIP